MLTETEKKKKFSEIYTVQEEKAFVEIVLPAKKWFKLAS